MLFTWAPKFLLKGRVHYLKLILRRVTKYNLALIFWVWDYSPDSSTPIAFAHLLFHVSEIKSADISIETSWKQSKLPFKNQITNTSRMSLTIFPNQTIFSIHINTCDLIPTSKQTFLIRTQSTNPNRVFMFAKFLPIYYLKVIIQNETINCWLIARNKEMILIANCK